VVVFRDVMLFSTFQRIHRLHLKGRWSKKCWCICVPPADGLEVRQGSQHMCAAVALLSADNWFHADQDLPTTKLKEQFSFEKWGFQECSPSDRHSVTFQGTPIATCWPLWNFRNAKSSHLLPPQTSQRYTNLCVWHSDT